MRRALVVLSLVIAVLCMAVPSLTAQGPLTYDEQEILSDDFSGGSGWSKYSDPTSNRDYVAGEYEITSRRQNWLNLGPSPMKAPTANYSVEVDARLYQGDSAEYGFVFNYNDAMAYFFAVNPAARWYRVYRVNNYTNKWEVVIQQTRSESINMGSEKNVLKLVQAGPQVDFYINGNYINSIQMKTYTKRNCDIALYARLIGVEACHARFDNFRLCTIILK